MATMSRSLQGSHIQQGQSLLTAYRDALSDVVAAKSQDGGSSAPQYTSGK